jgi:hypothetical protein
MHVVRGRLETFGTEKAHRSGGDEPRHETLADRVAGRVPNDGADEHGDPHRHDAHGPSLSESASDEHRRLARDDEADERSVLEEGEKADRQQDGPRVCVGESIESTTDIEPAQRASQSVDAPLKVVGQAQQQLSPLTIKDSSAAPDVVDGTSKVLREDSDESLESATGFCRGEGGLDSVEPETSLI